uniref:G_PROTEIN_RECEP_F1_2 domain-containing protein n=1 Tax=Heterorhabditis bacteriophora TaxID=37862 RepID=A0A1I7WZG0_HETBA
MSKAALDIVSGCLLGFNILGTFGNLNIIVATARTKALRKKFGILLAILACSDLLCLWYEFQSYVRMTFGLTRAPLISCYWANVGYIFIETFEVYMILAVAVDRLHALQFPIKYKVFTTNIYVAVMISPGLCIGLFFAMNTPILCLWFIKQYTYYSLTKLINKVVSYALMPPNVIREVCVLPFSMPDKVSTWWNHYNMWGAVITVLIYCLTYFQLYCFSPFVHDFRKVKKQKAILNTLIVQVVVFFFSSVGDINAYYYFIHFYNSRSSVFHSFHCFY